MKIENYKEALNSINHDNVKYQHLLRTIENSRGFSFRKKAAALAAVLAMTSVIGITAAAESGMFPSLEKIFTNNRNNENIPIETEIDNYAFVPEIPSIITDDITINFTEAISDNHTLILCMDIVCSDEILEKMPQKAFDDNSVYNKDNIYTDFSLFTANGSNEGVTLDKREGNTLSMHLRSTGIRELKDLTEIYVEDFGYSYTDNNGFLQFVPLCSVRQSVQLPDNFIRQSEIKKASSQINDIPATIELSQFGFSVITETENGAEILNNNKYFFKSENFIINMKDGRIFDSSNSDEILGTSEHSYTDSSYCEYIGFTVPVEINKIASIEINNSIFIFD